MVRTLSEENQRLRAEVHQLESEAAVMASLQGTGIDVAVPQVGDLSRHRARATPTRQLAKASVPAADLDGSSFSRSSPGAMRRDTLFGAILGRNSPVDGRSASSSPRFRSPFGMRAGSVKVKLDA